MSAQPQRNVMDEKKQMSTRISTTPNGADSAKTDWELLRWRAEVLMDEMMLGGVDFAANGLTTMSTSSATRMTPGPVQSTHESTKNDVDAGHVALDRYSHDGQQNGVHGSPVAPAAPNSSSVATDLDTSQRDVRYDQTRASPSETFSQVRHERQNHESQPWVASAEERYRQLIRPQLSADERAAAVEEGGVEASLGAQAIWQGGDNSEPPGANGQGAYHPDSDLPTVTAIPTAVRGSALQAARTTSGIGGNSGSSRRSNLLPRLSTADVEALQHEIFTLQNEVDHILPIGHDSNKRVRHLLERAQAILQQDAMRSAEVEYYLQQVRTIFQRVQQTVDWSSIYRNRLIVYLAAWLLLSGIVLVACYLYQNMIEDFVATMGGLQVDGVILQHLLTAVATFFAGTLGGALGTLSNLQHQNRLPHGFIDRKFGLRGLILPVMGGIIGLLCYAPIGLLFSLFGLNPSRNILLSVFPVLLAFIYGVSQESIYGTRE